MNRNPKPVSPVATIAGSLIFLALASVVAAFMSKDTYAIWRLANDGKEVAATVARYSPESCGKHGRSTCHYHSLRGDGQQFYVKLHEQNPVGATIPLVYLPSDTEVARPGHAGPTPLDYLQRELTLFDLFPLLFILVAAASSLSTVAKAARQLSAPAAPLQPIQAAMAAEVPMPPGLELSRQGGQLEITRRLAPPYMAAIFTAAFGFFFFAPVRIVLSGQLIGLVFMLFALPFVYVLAVLWFNRVRLVVGRGKLTTFNEPVPIPRLAGKVDLATAQIKQIRVQEHRGNKGGITYAVNAMLTSGDNVDVLSGIPSIDQAQFIEQEVERFLNIKDAPVPGEAQPSPFA